MKLELIKKYEPENIDSHWGCVAINDETTVSLVKEKNNENYSLIIFSPEEMKKLSIDFLERFSDTYMNDNPVLFSKNGGLGIIKNQTELFFYPTIESNPIKIKIDNKKLFRDVLPPKSRLRYPNPISDSNIFPICFQHTAFVGNESRYFSFLNLDTEKQKAKWESWSNLDSKKFKAHGNDEKNLPKVDNIMIKNEDVFIFTSGEKVTSVNKWGMDYYGIAKTTKKGEVVDVLLDSGNLHLIDEKKRGVNGVFCSSQKYAILTPIFQSDEWKGKQKLFSIDSKELIDIDFPRGFGKYPRIIQHIGDYFFVYLWDTRHFAICKEKEK